MGWFTQGRMANAGRNAILADTGSLVAGVLPVTVIAWVEREPATIEIVLRDAANAADVNVQTVSLMALDSKEITLTATLTLNQRIIVRAASDVSGDIHASILT